MPSKILSLTFIGLAALVGTAAASDQHPMKLRGGVGTPESNEARRLSLPGDEAMDDDGASPDETSPPVTSPTGNVPEPPTPVETPWPVTPVETPTPEPTAVYELLDCYRDGPSPRIMEFGGTSPYMTAVVCEGLCQGNSYFGTQYGCECWCGDENTDLDLYGPANECDFPCAGDSAEICGGFYRMSVYQFIA